MVGTMKKSLQWRGGGIRRVAVRRELTVSHSRVFPHAYDNMTSPTNRAEGCL